MEVSLLSLAPQHAPLRAGPTQAFTHVIASAWYVLGEKVRGFEREYAALNHVAHTVGAANGLEALVRALKVGPGKAVVVPAWPDRTEAQVTVTIRSFSR